MRGLFPAFRYLGRHKRKVALAMFCIVAANLAALLVPYILRLAIDAINDGTTSGQLALYGFVLLGAAVVEGIFRFYSRYLAAATSRDVEYELRNDLFRHFQRQDAAFFQRSRTGDLMARATNDLNAVQRALGPGISNSVNTVVAFVGTVAVMLTIDVQLALYSAIILPLMSLTFGITGGVIQRRYEKVQAGFSDISTKVQENASGIRVVKAYAQETAELEAFQEVNQRYIDNSISHLRIQALLWPAMFTVGGIATIVVLYFGGQDVIAGRISVGELVQFIAYVGALRWPMIALGWVMNLIQQGSASMIRLQQILQTEPTIRDAREPHPIQAIRGEILFRNVTLRHADATVLAQIDLHVPAGSTVAIVGPTGSGKSSLAALVPRLWDPTEGQVLIDGIDVRLIPLDLLRRSVGFVPQETFLFSEPIRENIAFGVDETSQEKVEWAATVSQLERDVEQFPHGYETYLGERGVTLSGGQKQRTAIARAVLKDPRILILDDALSAVDTYTEEEILRRLREVMRSRTSLIISHRTSTVRDADKIVVL
ncbi:MAG: ABC transporter ATP-binding protein, partial [Chloroflexia bacterium]|nr:ABC transporter ATP-binding protein [Chloroflexia bacterium]